MSATNPAHEFPTEEDDLLDADDAAEEIDEDSDHPMEGGDEEYDEDEGEEIQLQNDSAAYFDTHTDSIFCIAQHPMQPSVVLTGGGDDVAYIFDSSLPDGPLLPPSYETTPQPQNGTGGREGLKPMQKLDGHTDSVNAVAFTQPTGEYAVTAGLDGKLRAWRNAGGRWTFVAEAQEVPEINWLSSSPHPSHPNVIALGANDGSVWVYEINAQDQESPLTIVHAFYLHTESCTAGAWTPDGKLLATVSEDGSFHVYDVFGEAAAAGVSGAAGGQAVVNLTAEDQRFAVEGGLYSVEISPGGAIAAVGGAGGNIKIVGLPRLGAAAAAAAAESSSTATNNKKSNAKGGKRAPQPGGVASSVTSSSQAGQILASLQAQSDGVETLSFSQPPLTLLAAGSVDGSIALFDVAHRFAVRRHIKDAHEEFAVVKVEFVRPNPQSQQQQLGGGGGGGGGAGGWFLTSAGMDGVVRRWDARGGTTAAGQGFVREWRGHRGEGEGGGVLGFVQGGGGGGQRIVTAGDDGVSLVFKADF